MNKIREFFLQHPILSPLIVLLLLSLPLLLVFITTYGKTNVNLVVAPNDASIAIDGEPGRLGGNILEPGRYEIIVTREGFRRHQQSIEVGYEDMRVPIVLDPVSDEAWEFVKNNPDQYRDVEAVAGQLAQREGELFRQRNPIVNHLPYRSLIFDIDYKLNDTEDDIIIIITAGNKTDREYALSQIKNWGYDPENFDIEYSQ